MSPPILVVSYFFHLVATVIWLGGLAILTIMVNPAALRTLEDTPQLYALLSRLRKRFAPLANFSLAILIATGMIQMSLDDNYLGVLDFGNAWSVAMLLKHVAVSGMVVCSLAIQYLVVPSIERTSLLVQRGKADPAEWQQLYRRETRLTWINNGLGALVLVFTAWMTAID